MARLWVWGRPWCGFSGSLQKRRVKSVVSGMVDSVLKGGESGGETKGEGRIASEQGGTAVHPVMNPISLIAFHSLYSCKSRLDQVHCKMSSSVPVAS